MTFDGLDDYRAGRCDDCAQHAGAVECGRCQFNAPPIAGQADLERTARLDAERVTLQFAVRNEKRMADLSDSPLWGGPRQGELF